MSNEMIIFNARVKLMEKGILKGTGNIITVENEDGKKVQMEEPEEIHTFAGWKALKFNIKKGEKAVASFPIWKHTKRKPKEEGEEEEKMFMTKAFFFKAEQVEPMKEVGV